MSNPRIGKGADPLDGLRLAGMQQRADQLVAQLKFKSFGFMQALPLVLLAIGIVLLVNADQARSRLHFLVLGWAMGLQGAGLWWYSRHIAHKELELLRKKILAMTSGEDGQAVAAAAASAQSLLLNKKPR